MTTTWSFNEVSVSVAYDGDNGLEITQINPWHGLWVQTMYKTPTRCDPGEEAVDNGGIIQHFGCTLEPPPYQWPSPGTYRLGTIIWDTSGFSTMGAETIAAVISGGDLVTAVINGNIVDVSSQVVLGSHLLQIIPEPGTAVLLGLGLVGLLVTARRRRVSSSATARLQLGDTEPPLDPLGLALGLGRVPGCDCAALLAGLSVGTALWSILRRRFASP